jgi:hypothetical protein
MCLIRILFPAFVICRRYFMRPRQAIARHSREKYRRKQE